MGKMEDFGFLKNSGIGFEDLWEENAVISEVGIEKTLNKDGLRYRLNRTEKEADEVGRLMDLPRLHLSGKHLVSLLHPTMKHVNKKNSRLLVRHVRLPRELRVVQVHPSVSNGWISMDTHV